MPTALKNLSLSSRSAREPDGGAGRLELAGDEIVRVVATRLVAAPEGRLEGAQARMMVIVRTCAAILCACQSACSADARRPEDVVGTYVLNRGSAQDMIHVRSDGRYVHSYVLPGRMVAADSGTWQLGDYDGQRVLFDNFRSWSRAEREGQGAGDVAPAPNPAEYPALLERGLFGEERLVVNADLGWYYVKTDSRQ